MTTREFEEAQLRLDIDALGPGDWTEPISEEQQKYWDMLQAHFERRD